MGDQLIDAAKKFDDAVRATAVVGALVADVAEIKKDVGEIKADVKHVRSVTDRWGGSMMIVGSLISIAVSLVVSLVGGMFR